MQLKVWLFNASCNPASTIAHSWLADSKIFRGGLAPVFLLFVAHLGTLIEGVQAGPLYSRDMDEYILAAAVGLNKSKSLCRVEPLHSTSRHIRSPYCLTWPL